VGNVEIFRERVYPIDPDGVCGAGTDIFVSPGTYPLYRKGDAYCWLMTGRVNERIEKVGDGLFLLNQGDRGTGLEVQFPSRTFGPEQFADLMSDPGVQPGPERRLEFTIHTEDIK
jgi:hypothetical protein